MFHHLVPLFRMKGVYNPGSGNVAIDMRSFLFNESASTEAHEITHFFLSKYTNYGFVYSLLSEIVFYKHRRKMIIPEQQAREVLKLLHENMYNAQEGFAHVLQARTIHKEGGREAVRAFEHSLPESPRNPRLALSHCVDFVKFDQDLFDGFIEKFSFLVFNTSLHLDVVNDPSLLLDPAKLASYLSDEGHNPDRRFVKLCRAIQRDKAIIRQEDALICSKNGIPYKPIKTNKEMATLINHITATFTDSPQTLTENDINVVSGQDVFSPVYDGLVLCDANMQSDARTGLSESEIHHEALRFRTVYVYNYAQTADPVIPFYGYSKTRNIMNVVPKHTQENLTAVFRNNPTTIIDGYTLNYETNSLRPERAYLQPNIVWYKNFIDAKIFLGMLNKLDIHSQFAVLQFTEGHKFLMYIMRILGESHIHFLTAFPYTYGKLLRETKNLEKVEGKESLQALFTDNERHINNFCHDILGLDPFLNVTAMVDDPEKHLTWAIEVRKNGMGRNDLCICGSEIKYKYCHGNSTQ